MRKPGNAMNDHPALTEGQKMVRDALLAAGTPLGAYALLERLQSDRFKAPLQIYRALDKLVEYGLVHRLESLNAFVACAHAHSSNSPAAFAICDVCGHVSEFTDPAIARSLARWSKQNAFHSSKVTVELRGLCKQCESQVQ